jgi:hypothetical protein
MTKGEDARKLLRILEEKAQHHGKLLSIELVIIFPVSLVPHSSYQGSLP